MMGLYRKGLEESGCRLYLGMLLLLEFAASVSALYKTDGGEIYFRLQFLAKLCVLGGISGLLTYGQCDSRN